MKSNKFESNPSVDKKIYKVKVMAEVGKCARCPPHGKENLRKRPKSDKYKNKRKGR